MAFYHTPVLLQECLEAMQIKADGTYLDVTFGGGGHSKAVLTQLTGNGQLYSVDQDPDARRNIPEGAQNFTFIAANFRHIERFMDYYGKKGKVDAVLADLGVSSHHFDAPERGFSFRSETPLLDMRMNTSSKLSAQTVINEYSEEDLANIIYKYGELKQSRQIARKIVQARAEAPIQTVGQLLEVVRPCLRAKEEKKQMSMLFQAIRIEVNDELRALEEMLDACLSVLKKGGRLVVITYHSLEDRIVKNFLKSATEQESLEAQIYGGGKSRWRVITRKPITPSAQELEENPRSRSAKLRVAELR